MISSLQRLSTFCSLFNLTWGFGIDPTPAPEKIGLNYIFDICTSYFVQRFDIEMPQELPNKTSEDVHLNGEFMYFWPARCTREIHVGCEPDAVMGKIEIHVFEEKPKTVGS